MEKFYTLPEAAQFAATRCGGWSFATSDERYNVKELLILAETSDSEDPIDEGNFYVVSHTGAIGLCIDGGAIDWLFLSDAAPNDILPTAYETSPQTTAKESSQVRFCTNCGTPVPAIPGARFCGNCGASL